MTPNPNSPQPSQNAEKSPVASPSQPGTAKPASQNNEEQSQNPSQETSALDQTVLSQRSTKSSQEREPSPNALVQAGLYGEESQDPQNVAEASQKSATASQPASSISISTSISASQPTEPDSQPTVPEAENQATQKLASQ